MLMRGGAEWWRPADSTAQEVPALCQARPWRFMIPAKNFVISCPSFPADREGYWYGTVDAKDGMGSY